MINNVEVRAMDMKSRLCEAEWRTPNDIEISPVFSQGEMCTKGHFPSPLRLVDLTALKQGEDS